MGRCSTQADFNGDGAVNLNDLTIMGTYYDLDLRTPRLLADFDGDWDVDAADINVIRTHANMTGAAWADGDLDGDGVVDEDDLDLAYAQFGLDLNVVC